MCQLSFLINVMIFLVLGVTGDIQLSPGHFVYSVRSFWISFKSFILVGGHFVQLQHTGSFLYLGVVHPISLILEVLWYNFDLFSSRETPSSHGLKLPWLGAFCGGIPPVRLFWPSQCLWVGEGRLRLAGAKMLSRMRCSLWSSLSFFYCLVTSISPGWGGKPQAQQERTILPMAIYQWGTQLSLLLVLSDLSTSSRGIPIIHRQK